VTVVPDLEAMRAYIGTEYHPRLAEVPDEPVRRVDIRGYCEAIADTNPLWLDDDYARAHGYASLLAPPGFVEAYAPNYRLYHRWENADYLSRFFPFAYPFPDNGLPRILLLGEDIEQIRPVVPGEVVIGHSTLRDVEIKDSASAGRLVIGVFEKRYVTDAGEHVSTVTWRNAAAEARPVKSDRGAGRPLGADDQLPVPEAGQLADRADPAGLAPGQRLPNLVQRIDITMMIRWTAVLWDMGTPHFDWDYARECYGLPAPLVHGPMLAALNRRVLTDWMTPEDTFVSHSTRLRGVSACGDHAISRTEITSVEQRPAGVRIGLATTMTNQWGSVTSLSDGVCLLSRDGRPSATASSVADAPPP
jgi:acyl dehydratase